MPTLEAVVPDPDPASYHYVPAGGRAECPQIKMARLNGSIFFGAVAHLQQELLAMQEQAPRQKHLVLMASGINFVDLAGAEFLADTARRYAREGGSPSFYRMKDNVAATLRHGGFMAEIGEHNLHPAKSRPADALLPQLDRRLCAQCPHHLFTGCPTADTTAPAASSLVLTEGVMP